MREQELVSQIYKALVEPMTPSDKARGMLAAEYEAAGWFNNAKWLRKGTPSRDAELALRAIDKAWNEAVAECAAIAIKWRDENKEAASKARKRGRLRNSFDGDETSLVMAEQLEGAAIECNAIADAIRALALDT